MKKTININISGIIFNIEEDGYARLKHYLDEIKRYFARYDDTGEISADIENRVAEIFSSKLSPGKQVITAEDVESLIAQMGNVADFEAVEEPEPSTERAERATYEEKAYQQQETYTTEPPVNRRLFRDGQRKIIGGVASGIAHYLGIDPFWIRLLFVIILFDLFLTFSFSSALLIGYVILWIIVPERNDLKEDRKLKKMFRDPEGKIIGGVSAGIANYFGVDPTLIRILFILAALLGGSGVLAYIIIWIITPEARTLTDRMQMQGEPLTLTNIEHNIKKNLNIKEGEEENIFVKILLFPFRLIAAVFSGGSKAVNPLIRFLGDALRVLAGIFLILVGFFTFLVFTVVVAVYAGVNPEATLELFDIRMPVELIQATIPWVTAISSYLVIAIPAFLIIILGISLLRRHWSLPRPAAIAVSAFWVICVITASVTIPGIALNFQERDYLEKELSFAPDSGQVVKLGLIRGYSLYPDEVDLTIKGTPDSLIRLEERFYANGRTTDDALENANAVNYATQWDNNTLMLGRTIELKEGAPFRGQSMRATLYIPYDQKFTMDYNLRHILLNTLHPFGYGVSDLRGNTWVFNENAELRCLECPERTYSRNDRWPENSPVKMPTSLEMPENARRFAFEDFDQLEINGNLSLVIRQSERFSVAVEGDEADVEDLQLEQDGDRLTVGWKRNWNNFTHEPVIIYVNLPDLRKLELNGGANSRTGRLTGSRLRVELNGASALQLDADYDEIELDMSGAAEAYMEGRATRLDADLNGASELNAYDLTTRESDFELSGASEAEVRVRDRLKVDASGGSVLRYKGDPSREIERSGGASIRRSND